MNVKILHDALLFYREIAQYLPKSTTEYKAYQDRITSIETKLMLGIF